MNVSGIQLDEVALRDFCRKWSIRNLYLFGSILSENFRLESDVDILADFDEGVERDAFSHMDMEEELAAIIGRKVDLVSRSAVEAGGNRFYHREIISKAQPIIAER